MPVLGGGTPWESGGSSKDLPPERSGRSRGSELERERDRNYREGGGGAGVAGVDLSTAGVIASERGGGSKKGVEHDRTLSGRPAFRLKSGHTRARYLDLYRITLKVRFTTETGRLKKRRMENDRGGCWERIQGGADGEGKKSGSIWQCRAIGMEEVSLGRIGKDLKKKEKRQATVVRGEANT